MTGGAVQAACEAVRERVARAGRRAPRPAGAASSSPTARWPRAAGRVLGEPVEETGEYRHRPTDPLDPTTGQGDAHVQFAFAAHRAVVDVDVELGPGQGGRARHRPGRRQGAEPAARSGPDPGRHRPGLGLALMEEIQVARRQVRNPSFTDYLIPTILDMPPMRVDVLEHADPIAPYGLRGVGEPPTISSPPAIAAAIRAATGRPLARVPVRPERLVGLPTAPRPTVDELGALEPRGVRRRAGRRCPRTRRGWRAPPGRGGRSPASTA